jgi:hypothetical protein
LLAPIFVFVVGLYFRSEVVKGKLGKLLAAVVLVLLGVTAVISFNGNSRGRFEQVSVFSDPHVAQVLSATNTASQKTFFDYKYLVYLIELVREYSKYFTAEFYIGDTVLPIRYSSPGMGLMTYSGFVLYVLGVLYLIKERRINLILALLIISPLPAALTSEDSPNLHRSLVMLPFIAMAAAVSFERILNDIRFGKYILGLLAILFMLNWHYFAVSYIYRAPLEIGFKRNVSAKELALYLNEVRSDYEEIIITNDPDDPYPWYAFYNNLDPKEFNSYAVKRGERESWQFENLIFTQMECPSGDEFPGPFEPPKDRNILVVDGFRCSAESKLKDGMQAQIVKQIHDPDGTVAYTLWGRI